MTTKKKNESLRLTPGMLCTSNRLTYMRPKPELMLKSSPKGYWLLTGSLVLVICTPIDQPGSWTVPGSEKTAGEPWTFTLVLTLPDGELGYVPSHLVDPA